MSLIGTTLVDRYRITQLIGEGGMGAVYVAEQSLGTTTRKVAVKTLHPHLSHDEKLRARFEREVSTVARLEHPNTIQVFDFGATPDGTLFIVMELAVGKSLADVLEAARALEPARADRILQQICGSLDEAHRAGIVHRDLKPENIMLTERAGKQDFVKVLDFGIARNLADDTAHDGKKLTQAGTVLGTPPYMSPEQFTGQPVGPSSDIYSLGVMAFEMVTGELPFHANSSWEWASAHMTQDAPPIESTVRGAGVPVAFRQAVARALQKSPSARFAKVEDFAAALEGGGPVAPPSRVAATQADLASPWSAAASPRAGGTEPGAPAVAMRPGGTQVGAAVDAARPGGTQMGAAAAYAAPGAAPFAAAGGAPMAPAGYGAPAPYAAPAVPAYGAPAGYQGAPPRPQGGSGSRTGLILALVGALAVLGGLVVYAVGGSSGGGDDVVVTQPTTTAVPTTAATTEPSDGTDGTDGLDGLNPSSPSPDLTPATPTLTPAPNPAPRPTPRPNPVPAPPVAPPAPAPVQVPVPAPAPVPIPVPAPVPVPAPPPAVVVPSPPPRVVVPPANNGASSERCAGLSGMQLVRCKNAR